MHRILFMDPGVKSKYFNGNNRGFSLLSNEYKTRMDVKVYFPSSGNATATLTNSNKKVATTIFYDENYKVIGSGTAGKNMGIHDVVGNANKVSYNAYHNIGIPYAEGITPNITYNYNATIYRDRGYTITGSHDRVPSHDIYIYISQILICMQLYIKELTKDFSIYFLRILIIV